MDLPADESFDVFSDGWPAWPPRNAELTQQIERSVREILNDGQWGTYPETTAANCDQPGVYDRCRAAVGQAANEWAAPEGLDSFGSASHVRLCPSGSSAIELALRALGVGPAGGKRKAATKVILSAYDYPGNFRTVELLGGRPVLCDTEPTRGIRSGRSPAGISLSSKAIQAIQAPPESVLLISHLHGQVVDSGGLAELCRQRRWFLVEDACQAIGAGRIRELANGQTVFVPVGTLAEWTTYSFGGSKPLTCGNGGALATEYDGKFQKLQAMVDRPSDTFPMSTLQCAALLPQLSWLNRLNRIRCENARRLSELDWAEVGCAAIWDDDPAVVRAPYKFPVLARDAATRSKVIAGLRSIGLPCGEGFRAMHRTSDRRSDKPVPLINAAKLSDSLLVIDHRALLPPDVADRVRECLAEMS
ncbi:DegT/DnrJ/EryC1/StrS family aminotransferase [Rhodopirellula bahusiensis]|uniref:Aminotransferase n=1 Tax=Rhodopirellula bahusiensis TaxID=2014065 RepID=A0A2G1W1N4_9BACT|nr:DegT/DnrJ/EryC1/StrS family aminotransferase [Rhodopirellula bahusiensis]PHQ32948.1 aminotransferase [Rhodopirellula bahusiensis]